MLLEGAELRLRRADEITGTTFAQPLQIILSRDAAIKDPHAPRLAVLGFHGPDDVLERGRVDLVAIEDFIRQRKTLGGDHQCDDELFAIRPVISGVAALRFLDTLRAALEVCARQIVEDDVEARAEEILPLRREMFFQRALVLDDAIEAAIQTVLVRHGAVAIQQHIHRRLREPFFMHKEFAARIEQTIDREQLKHLRPRHLAALSAEPLLPERIEAELLP